MTSPGSTVVSPSLQFKTSARTAAFEATCGLAPPWHRHTVPPEIALFLHRFPVRAVALHWTIGTLTGRLPDMGFENSLALDCSALLTSHDQQDW
jgi:hypothetical protein